MFLVVVNVGNLNPLNRVALKCSFEDVWSFLNQKGSVHLRTDKTQKEFSAEARVCRRGKNAGNKFIVFLREACADRCYENDWGFYCNSSGTWIGMYCKALDRYLSKL